MRSLSLVLACAAFSVEGASRSRRELAMLLSNFNPAAGRRVSSAGCRLGFLMMQSGVSARDACTRLPTRGVTRAGCEDISEEQLTRWIEHKHFSQIDSTQSYVEREYSSFDQDKLTVVSADFQTVGRGTRDRSWHATRAQSALMTFFFKFPLDCASDFVNRNAPQATQVLAVSAVETLRSMVPEREDLVFGVKWPNDIVVNGKKIAGILARAEPSPGPRLDRLLLGIGVNINTDQEELDKIERIIWPATSLRAVSGEDSGYDVDFFRKKLATTFAANLVVFFAEGFTAFRHAFNGVDVFMGQQVTFRVSSSQVLEGVYLGINDDGHIVLRLMGGEVRTYPSGEVVPAGTKSE